VAEPTVVEIIGEIALPKRGTVLRVALVDYGNDFGVGIDARVFVTDAAHDRKREARARAATSGRRWKGAHDGREFFTGPTRQGLLLQPSAADELSELLALAALRAEAMITDQDAAEVVASLRVEGP
jgi:hypothetical protein